MSALGIHQHRVDEGWSALPLPPRSLVTPWQVGFITPFQHHAFDRLGILAGTERRRIVTRGGEFLPRCKWNDRRHIDAGVAEPADQRFEARAPLDERAVTHVAFLVEKKIIGAQMRRKLTEHFRRDGLAVETLLQRIERLHVALAHDQQLSIDRTVEGERLREIRKAVRYVLAGAGIEPSNTLAILARPCCSLHADAVPLPFRDKRRRIKTPKLAF